MSDLKERLSNLSKRMILLWLLIIVVGIAIGASATTGMLRCSLSDAFTEYLFITLIISAIFIVVFLGIIFKASPMNSIADETEGGYSMRMGTYGTSTWMKVKQIKQVFNVTNVKNTVDPIYGQLSTNGEEVVAFKKKAGGASGNKNVLIMASMGAGKSFGPVRTNLLQAIERGDSFITTDPSKELYSSLAHYCKEEKGADVKVLNLDEPEYSEFWNCLEETIDPKTERLDSSRLNDFVSIFMQNSGGGGDEDDFWYGSALNLIKAVIGYVSWKKEKSIMKNFIDLYSRIAGRYDDEVIQKMKDGFVSFPYCREQILKVAKEKGEDIELIKEVMHEIQYDIPTVKYTISEVFFTLLHFTDVEDELADIPDWHPAKIAYLMYQTNGSDSVRQSALQGSQLRFQIFSDEKIREVLSNDGIHLRDINRKQSAYFVVTSDKTDTLKPIASLFFSFFFKDAQDEWDTAKQIAEAKGEPNPCRPVTVMLDEFYSLGVIGGSPDKFGTYMSNSRKRELHIYIIVQGYSQLAARYGDEIGNIIQGGCSTLLYLGGNDPDTCKFISEFASGESTILTESHQQTGGLVKTSGAMNISSGSRFLLTTNEARKWKDKVMVVKQGEDPAKINPFPWIEHPAYKLCKDLNIYEEVKPLNIRLDALKQNQKRIDDPDTYIMQRIQFLGKVIQIEDESVFKPQEIVIQETKEIKVEQVKTRKSKKSRKKEIVDSEFM